MPSLPPLTAEGLLPSGDYSLTIVELAASELVLGWQGGRVWDAPWRAQLVANLAIMFDHLWRVGVRDVFINGSFVENKPHPNDIDGYFVCDRDFCLSGELERQLQAIDSVWTWDPASRYPPPTGGKRQLPMWHKYRVELFPHIGQFTGIVDQFGYELEFPSAFRQSRSFLPKGIVKLIGGTQ
jgi:hypothetical protein